MFYKLPYITNEHIKAYAPNSTERELLKEEINATRAKEVELPMIIDGKEIITGKFQDIRPPHDHNHLLGRYHQGGKEHVQMAINAALKAKPAWEALSPESRAAIFLKAADLLATKYRYQMNAVTMLGQSKNAFQAEIDCVAELADFWRYNAKNMYEIYAMQPNSSPTIWNRTAWRPLEGFVFALTPFNFTSIAGNLPSAPAIMGNVCVWKPSKTSVYSAWLIMKILREAGLPNGVINLVYCSGPDAADVIFKHKEFAGLHFTGSTEVFNGMWKEIAENLPNYRSYPRIVGETGGKDYVFAHPTACPKAVATALVRGSFEYQGQKCSAASRAYIPASMWEDVKDFMQKDLKDIKTGGVEDFSNFVNAVIDEASYDKLAATIQQAQLDKDTEIVIGGKCDKSKGYFVEPTVIRALKPDYVTMREELFGPVLTVYVYPDSEVSETLDLLDSGSAYALTGAIFCQDRYEIDRITKRLMHTAGNFYINDKPTGAQVDQQPFGGGRASGTNDKAGTMFNLLRWASPQAIKEAFVPATDYMYPNFLES
ncbi:MAG: L-glutamate gamma-semialdehyde dehydrogenase [Bacteroidales bacterium]|jgi:1-pyrroline-5-carboxylate dehydrogenase|nr:L-glutamate gamma-semialdehyde dehydrogenase [Bacteroidales bacterium]